MELEVKQTVFSTLINILKIENDSLLNRHIFSESKFIGTTIRYGNWEGKGATLEDLVDFIENGYNILATIDKKDNRNFEFVIPMNNLEKAKEILRNDYGIDIKTKKQKVTFWIINRNNGQ